MPAPRLPRAAASLRSLLIDPPHSLYRQAWAPRLQRHGTVNADGFGVGWYADGDPVPARYRRAVPIWGDPSLPDLARVTRSGAVLAAVRSATAGTALGEAAAAPFASGPWLFSHNGRAGRLAGRRAGGGWRAAPSEPPAAVARGDGRLGVPVGARPGAAAGRDGAGRRAGRRRSPPSRRPAGPGGSTSCSPTGARSRPPPAATRSGTGAGGRAAVDRSRPSRPTTSPAGPRFRRHRADRLRRRRRDRRSQADRSRPLPTLVSTDSDVSTEGIRLMTTIEHRLPPDYRAALAARRRPRRAHRDAEVAAAEVVLRRAGQRAVREDHRAARVLPDPGRAVHPAGRRAGDRRAHRGAASWSSSARARRRRRGCCSTRCATRARCAATCRST